MKKINLVIAGFFLFLLFPILADATTIKRTGSNVSLASDEVVEGNFYAVGNDVSITGEIQGDAIIMGGTVTSVGTVAEDSLIVAGTVSLGGSTTDDVRIVAGEVIVSGAVGGSLSIVGGSVTILSTATIAGDVMIYGGKVVVEGQIEGFLYGTSDSLRIDGTVVSGVDVTTQNIQLGSRSAVEGNITYVSNNEIIRASDAQVGGTIVRNSPPNIKETFSFQSFVINFFILLFTVLVFYLVLRPRVERFVAYPMFNQHTALRAVLFGFLFLFIPVAIVVLMASILGALVGVILLLLYIFLFAIAVPAMSYVVAGLVMKLFKHTHLTPLHLIIATAVVVIIAHVPKFGLFLLASLYLFTVGIIISILLTHLRR